jgi:hypothetical protein
MAVKYPVFKERLIGLKKFDYSSNLQRFEITEIAHCSNKEQLYGS